MARFYYDDHGDDFPQYVSIGEGRRKAGREGAKRGGTSSIVINGSQIAKTFWGKSWCLNLERYSDYANRLPRGRTYVRTGCVVDLQIERGTVTALVSGTVLYRVNIKVSPIAAQRWKLICQDCSGAIDSLVELL